MMIRIKLQTSTNEETGEKEYKNIEYSAGNIYSSNTLLSHGNSCHGCVYLNEHTPKICALYPAMRNMVRCIQYKKLHKGV